jgi:hypothetical protein
VQCIAICIQLVNITVIRAVISEEFNTIILVPIEK